MSYLRNRTIHHLSLISSTAHAELPKEVCFYTSLVAEPVTEVYPGFAVPANSANFPALLTGNGAMTVGVLGPWYVTISAHFYFTYVLRTNKSGANSPHTHPRATELQIVVQGGPIYTEFIMENGARTVKNTVPLGSATIFP